MTTFTTEDREHAFGATINVEPIPFAGWVNTAPPHIVDSGASVMLKELDEARHTINVLRERIAELETLKVALQIMGIDADSILRKAQEK